MLTVEIPFPPSLNNAFASHANGGRHRSKEYTAWRTQAAWELRQQKAKPVIGAVEITITFKDRNRSCDLDNRIKPVLDLLVHCGIIDGDDSKTVRKITASWGGEYRAWVEIVPAHNWTARKIAMRAA